ncbi:hypothetical protein L1887_14473 [Cichorium endivia]|nr:hypothetical protein L1887_14473 [Cichorium endivia]
MANISFLRCQQQSSPSALSPPSSAPPYAAVTTTPSLLSNRAIIILSPTSNSNQHPSSTTTIRRLTDRHLLLILTPLFLSGVHLDSMDSKLRRQCRSDRSLNLAGDVCRKEELIAVVKVRVSDQLSNFFSTILQKFRDSEY